MKFFQPTIKQHFVRSNHKSARHSRINIFCATPSVLEEDEQRLLRQVLFSQKPDPTVVTKRNRGKALEKREITAATMVFSRESRAFKIVLMSVLLLSVVPRTAGLVTSQQFKHARIALLTERAESWVVNEESHIRPASKLRLSSALVERSKSPSFEERMRKLVAGKQRKDKEIAKKLPPNVKIVRTLEDYKRIVVGEKKRIVVVRFFAPWCKVRRVSVGGYCCSTLQCVCTSTVIRRHARQSRHFFIELLDSVTTPCSLRFQFRRRQALCIKVWESRSYPLPISTLQKVDWSKS